MLWSSVAAVASALLLTTPPAVYARPDGSPLCRAQGADAILAKVPQMQPMAAPLAPWTFTASSATYTPGQTISISVTGNDFKGLLLYVADDGLPATNGAPRGQFQVPTVGQFPFRNNAAACPGSEQADSSITHTALPNLVNYPGKQTFQYTVSQNPSKTGNLQVNAIVVQKCNTTNVFSYAIYPNVITIAPCPTLKSSTAVAAVTTQYVPAMTCPMVAPTVTPAPITKTATATVMLTMTKTVTNTLTQSQIKKCTRKPTATTPPVVIVSTKAAATVPAPTVTPCCGQTPVPTKAAVTVPPAPSATPCCGQVAPKPPVQPPVQPPVVVAPTKAAVVNPPAPTATPCCGQVATPAKPPVAQQPPVAQPPTAQQPPVVIPVAVPAKAPVAQPAPPVAQPNVGYMQAPAVQYQAPAPAVQYQAPPPAYQAAPVAPAAGQVNLGM